MEEHVPVHFSPQTQLWLQIVPVHHGNPRSGTRQHSEAFAGLLALEGGRELDTLASNTSPRSGPSSSTLTGLLQVVWGRMQLALFPTPCCTALACFVGCLHSTDLFPASYPYQSSSQPALSSCCPPCTLQALWSCWILPKLSMVLSLPLYRRQNGDQGLTIVSYGRGIKTHVQMGPAS